jgi:hypothetical protein
LGKADQEADKNEWSNIIWGQLNVDWLLKHYLHFKWTMIRVVNSLTYIHFSLLLL